VLSIAIATTVLAGAVSLAIAAAGDPAEPTGNQPAVNTVEHGEFTSWLPDLRSTTEPLFVGKDANLDPNVEKPVAQVLPPGIDWGDVSRLVSGADAGATDAGDAGGRRAGSTVIAD
jgi:hypothetical protein